MLWYFYQSNSDDNVTISNTFKPVYNGHSREPEKYHLWIGVFNDRLILYALFMRLIIIDSDVLYGGAL